MKAEKMAMTEAYKQLRPEECMRRIQCLIDDRLGEQVVHSLEGEGIRCRSIHSQNTNLPPSVTWEREVQSVLATNNQGQLALMPPDESPTALPVLYVLGSADLERRVLNDELTTLATGQDRSVTLIELGNGPRRENFAAVDSALAELQLVAGWSHWRVSDVSRLTELIHRFTRSIALASIKQMRKVSIIFHNGRESVTEQKINARFHKSLTND